MSKKTQAKCTGAMLTVGFHAANPPLIWRFDLERNHSFTLSMQGEEGDWELGVTTPKGDFYPVVHFAAREDAEEALAKVERVLAGKARSMSWVGKSLLWVGVLAGIVAMGVVGFGLAVSHLRPPSMSAIAPMGALAKPSSMPPAAAQEMPQGVPLSADDVLTPPPN